MWVKHNVWAKLDQTKNLVLKNQRGYLPKHLEIKNGMLKSISPLKIIIKDIKQLIYLNRNHKHVLFCIL
jgi:hypothetical protein